MTCVVKITVIYLIFPKAFSEITDHMNLLEIGSIPVDGSSNNTIDGLPINAIARDNFLLFPPDKVPANAFSY